MSVQSLFLTTSNAVLVGLLAVPVWLAWRYFRQPALAWLMAGYGFAALMFGLAPVSQGIVFPDANLAAAIFSPLVAASLFAAVVHLVGVEPVRRRRWVVGVFAGLALGYLVTLVLGISTVVRAGFVAVTFVTGAVLCFRYSRREPQVGLGLVGLSLLSYPAALALLATSTLPESLQLATAELPYVTLGLSVMAVYALRTRKDLSTAIAQRLEVELELSSLSRQAFQNSVTNEPDGSAASRLVDGFNRTVAHDLKGAISAVLAGTQYARQLILQGEPAQAAEFLPKVELQASAAIERVAAMQRLAQAQSDPLDLKEVSLETIAKSALSEVKRQQPDHQLDVPIFLMPLPTVVCDPGLMRVFFINLLSNAVKFSMDVENATVHIGALQDDPSGEPIFFIRDTGVGFDPKRAPELFTPFGRTDPSKSTGMGVGVPIALNIIERHGGRLWVESDVGQGSTFFFTLGKLLTNQSKDSAGPATRLLAKTP